MPESEPLQRRPAVSCNLCRRRKIRCNRENPCSNCKRSKNQNCLYDHEASHSPRRRLGHGQLEDSSMTTGSQCGQSARDSLMAQSRAASSRHWSQTSSPGITTASTISRIQSTSDNEPSVRKAIGLEAPLARRTQRVSNTETTISQITGSFSVHREEASDSTADSIVRGLTHKNRLFGPSHWVNGITSFRDMFELMEPVMRINMSKVSSSIQKCKALAKIIKLQRIPQLLSPAVSDLPSKDVTDKLVMCYLRTVETLYRILHIPTFERGYEAHWASPSDTKTEFLIQLKLVLAIGTVTYDERFSLRNKAVQWVYEAHSWLAQHGSKHRMDVQSLQTNILALLAQEMTGVFDDLVWISTGALLRTAVYMGLHRDPIHLSKLSTFAAEMRRRLWNTILEINLQSSITSGGPPFISINDFDVEAPGNFDDHELVTDEPTSKPEEIFTGSSMMIALHKTLPVRIAIVKSLNSLGPQCTYQDTLRLDTELRVLYKTLCRTVHGYKSGTGVVPPKFAIRALDFIIHRFLLALHVPFFASATHDTTYSYSRKVVIEACLKIWYGTYTFSPMTLAHSAESIDLSTQDDLACLIVCGSGFFRLGAMQASLLVASELRTQLQEDEGLIPTPLRQDLIAVLAEATLWSLQCIEAGETNIKGHLLICIIAAHIEGLGIKGLTKGELPFHLVRAANEAAEECLPLLEKRVAQDSTDGPTNQSDGLGLATELGSMEDWDFFNSEQLFDLDSTTSMHWMFDDSVST